MDRTLKTVSRSRSHDRGGRSLPTPASFATRQDPTLLVQKFGAERVRADASLPASQILPRVYLGSLKAAKSKRTLNAIGATHVICLTGPIGGFPRLAHRDLHYASAHIEDTEEAELQMRAVLQPFSDFFEEALESKPKTVVLVHCRAGVSRSACVLAACLMRHMHLRASEALRLLQSRRCIADPNEGFRRALLWWEHCLFGDGAAPSESASLESRPLVPLQVEFFTRVKA